MIVKIWQSICVAGQGKPFAKGYDERRGHGIMSASTFYGFDETQRVRYKRWKSYLQASLGADFELMAQLALRPESLSEQVQFAGKDETAVDKDGKKSASTTGAYRLDPLLQARLDLCKFRLSNLFIKPPQEMKLEAQVEQTLMLGLHPSMVEVLQSVRKSKPLPLTTLSPSPLPVVSNGSINGNGTSSLKPDDLAKSPVSEPTESVKPS